jgi:ankyrin repeat protein
MLVDHGANINFQKMKTKFTPLHWAAFNNDKKVVLYLLNNGAKLQMSFLNESPLEIAGSADNQEVVYSIINFWWKQRQQ